MKVESVVGYENKSFLSANWIKKQIEPSYIQPSKFPKALGLWKSEETLISVKVQAVVYRQENIPGIKCDPVDILCEQGSLLV